MLYPCFFFCFFFFFCKKQKFFISLNGSQLPLSCDPFQSRQDKLLSDTQPKFSFDFNVLGRNLFCGHGESQFCLRHRYFSLFNERISPTQPPIAEERPQSPDGKIDPPPTPAKRDTAKTAKPVGVFSGFRSAKRCHPTPLVIYGRLFP